MWALGVLLYTLLVGRPPFAAAAAATRTSDGAAPARQKASAQQQAAAAACGRILKASHLFSQPLPSFVLASLCLGVHRMRLDVWRNSRSVRST